VLQPYFLHPLVLLGSTSLIRKCAIAIFRSHGGLGSCSGMCWKARPQLRCRTLLCTALPICFAAFNRGQCIASTLRRPTTSAGRKLVRCSQDRRITSLSVYQHFFLHVGSAQCTGSATTNPPLPWPPASRQHPTSRTALTITVTLTLH
jgi:hypothetical protein